MLEYRELRPEEFSLAPREVPGSDVYNPQNSRILATIDDKGEVVATWTISYCLHLEPFWVREDHRKSMTIMRRMTEAMKAILKRDGFQCCYTVVLFSTPVLAKFARWFGARKIDGDLYCWTDPSTKI